jgi:hypothetical protein
MLAAVAAAHIFLVQVLELAPVAQEVVAPGVKHLTQELAELVVLILAAAAVLPVLR